MKRIITLTAFVLLGMRALTASAQDGLHISTALDAGTFGCGSGSFSDVNNTNYAVESYNNAYNVIWHKFTLTQTANVAVSLCGSGWDTYLYLLDQNGNYVDANDDNSSVCMGVSSYVSETSLSAGTYYIATGGYGSNTGNVSLELDVTGTVSVIPGAGTANAIPAGTFTSAGGTYTDTRSNDNTCLGNYVGQLSNDIFYQFTLSSAATVNINTCGSGIDTYLHLINAATNTEIAADDDGGCGNTSAISAPLAAGTYYVVSEGYGTAQGSITTTITVGAGLQAPCITYTTPETFYTGTAITALIPANACGAVSIGGTSTFSTGYSQPLGAAVDATGNVYVADAGNHQIYKITPAGTKTLLAGGGYTGFTNGNGSSALFYHPVGMAVDASGNVYVADEDNHAIRKIDPSGNVTTFAGTGSQGSTNGYRTYSSFYYPCGVAVDASGNVYVADTYNNLIRKIDAVSGNVTTLAGTGTAGWLDGSGSTAKFNQPFSIVVDASGNLFVTDRSNHRIRKITPTGVVSTVAGSGTATFADGSGTAASFSAPTGLTLDQAGNLYVTDENNQRVRKIDASGNVSTFAGSGSIGSANGAANASSFYNPFGIAADKTAGYLYVDDDSNAQVRKLNYLGYTITPALPAGLNFDSTTGTISGTPTAASTATTYTITANNNIGSSTTTLSITVSATGCSSMAAVPSSDQNYVATYTPRKELINVTDLSVNACDVMQTVQYFDGLGRPVQTVQVKGSPGRNDMVQPSAYDRFGREVTKYLPYTTTSGMPGSYKADALPGAQNNFYQSHAGQDFSPISVPSAGTAFEPSPLNRVLEQGAPGTDWQLGAHTNKIDYGTNDATSLTTGTGYWAKLFRVSIDAVTGARTLTDQGVYGTNQLHVTVTKDENWTSGKDHTTEEYKDKDGHVVLKRTFNTQNNTAEILSTYYVYDDFNNLCFVLPPKAEADNINASNPISQTTLDNLCYQYQFDERNRQVAKKIPGSGWQYTVYNILDQVVATQDANQRAQNQWIITKYDELGRAVIIGIWNNGNTAISPAGLKTQVYAQTMQWEVRAIEDINGYTLTNTYPNSLNTILSVNYYDDYNIMGMPYDHHTENSTMTNGLQTATKVNVLGTGDMLWTVNYYDDKGRVTHAYAQHYLGGSANLSINNYDHISNTYDFSNEVISTTRQHYKDNSGTASLAVTVIDSMVYDHMGRKLQSWSKINNGANILLSQTDYNELGQSKTKHLHSENSGSSYLQNIAYTYNEHGWLTNANSTKFTLNLAYNTNISTGAAPQFNGNIAEMYTTSDNTAANSKMKYSYDALNRLIAADHSNGLLTENGITYDKMGNIMTLNRMGASLAALSYNYNGNQLTTVWKGGATFRTYTYDGNGNATTDGGTKSINYNMLNLPATVAQGGSTLATYTYEASGTKVRNTGSDGTWDYVSGIVYKTPLGGTSPAIAFIQTEEGRAIPNGNDYSYQYNLKDHLGNNRVSLDKNGVLQEDEYYAFGLRNPKYDNSNNNRYLYNGKEIQTDLVSQYDYGARFYDPVIARWTSVDPLAEKYQLLSPYTYVANNPLRFIDEDGREIVIPTMKGDLTYRNGQLYQENGKVYKGKDAFVTKTLSALQTLSKLKDPTVKSVLKTLETSKEKVSLEAGYDGGITYPEDPSAVNEGKSTGSIISLDYTVKGEDGKTVESEILVGHELSHAYDNLKGNNKGEANTKSSASKKGEIRAVKFENKIRKEEGKKERTTYGGVPIKNK
ncbi:RHS repeat-associated protein [Mucilaginibacter gracilis]|uniref:RHS repeat-associated protein n=2 Tax=Mucilaginibacter gracilis TaxID=423350 RepID=A0A495J684_9SPHI|nr:DUF6443 domain-containing protein [Mucilaginibacter gracilis]RKR84506.1 RHS repeat-associated protein [Mucilaginibacter gracilis]